MAWGKLAIINLYECSYKIKNKKEISNFLQEICKVIKMNPQGKPLVKRFGKGKLEGFSAMQFIETSSITAHFDETKNRAFIDIFSCKNFNEKRAANFCKEFFNAKKAKTKAISRD